MFDPPFAEDQLAPHLHAGHVVGERRQQLSERREGALLEIFVAIDAHDPFGRRRCRFQPEAELVRVVLELVLNDLGAVPPAISTVASVEKLSITTTRAIHGAMRLQAALQMNLLVIAEDDERDWQLSQRPPSPPAQRLLDGDGRARDGVDLLQRDRRRAPCPFAASRNAATRLP